MRVPRAWGTGGEAMARGAFLDLRLPEAAVVDEETLDRQSAVLAELLPERPVVIGGCCCAHVGAVRGLAGRGARIGIVWLDAHGDLNTPETSPSGNAWGMPLRMVLDDGVVLPADVALVGARNLDPPEVEYLQAIGIDDSLERALADVDAVYVAFDLDVLDPSAAAMFMPEPGGPSIEDAEELLRVVGSQARVAGIGVTGQLPEERNIPVIQRLLAAVGL